MNPDHKLKEQTFKLVSWPSPQDYQEAIQAPLVNVYDQELQSGVVEQNALGLPRPRTGFFATVYKMQCGSADWAVRCFLNNIQDQQQRYAELSKFVMSDKLDCTVGFHYVEQGIKVRGTWYPILKMEWVEGETLGEFVEQHFHDFESMRNLALQFEKMMAQLKEAGVAHGDLQHGNIIVSEANSDNKDGRSDLALRLVDYDGMFVPALQGWQSNELGHRNYQHPARNSTHFDSSLDNFSAWLIYCSLICLAIDPLLWDELNGGDECLLFRQDDFQDISNSRAFSIMLYHQSPVIRECADWLAKLSVMPPDKVPYLCDELSRAQSITFKQRVRRAFDVRKIVSSKANQKTGEVRSGFIEAVSQVVNGVPAHSYKHAIPGKKRARAAGTALLVAVVLLYLVNIFGQAALNRNSTMFPKIIGTTATYVPELPSMFSVNEKGKTSVWAFNPVSKKELTQTAVRRYTVTSTGGGGGAGEVYIQSPRLKPGSLVANGRDLTGESRGMEVHYEGRWDGSVFSGMANSKFRGQTETWKFTAHPKLPESSWLKPKNQGAPRDEFKR